MQIFVEAREKVMTNRNLLESGCVRRASYQATICHILALVRRFGGVQSSVRIVDVGWRTFGVQSSTAIYTAVEQRKVQTMLDMSHTHTLIRDCTYEQMVQPAPGLFRESSNCPMKLGQSLTAPPPINVNMACTVTELDVRRCAEQEMYLHLPPAQPN